MCHLPGEEVDCSVGSQRPMVVREDFSLTEGERGVQKAGSIEETEKEESIA